jgi:arylsulfatase A-like enzyme
MHDEGLSRREFLQGAIAVTGASLTSPLLPTATARRTSKRPNLVFLYTEGQRWDALSLAGNPILKTPHQDRIGREGVVFKNSFCTNALCAPARAVALTGRHSHSTGALDNHVKEPLPANIPLFTDLLHEAGYEVALCGKAHIRNGAMERYWDYYFGFNAPVTNYYSPRFYEGRKGIMGPEAVYKGNYADDLVTDRALAWLQEPREKPFCLLLWHQAPHSPFYRPRRHLDLYNGIKILKPDTFDDDAKGYPGKPRAFADAENKIGTFDTHDAIRCHEELVKDYYAGLVAVDENIGRLLDQLERSRKLDDTVILQSSDHGYFLGEWRAFDKRFMHEPSIRVPLMIRYPKEFKVETNVEEMVLNLDIAPTLLELAGVECPEAMQGKSLVKLAKGQETNWRKDWLYEYYDYPGAEEVRPHRGIRTERYKLIHYYLEPQEYELYDLKVDPGENHNLYGVAAHRSLQDQLRNRLAELRRETGDDMSHDRKQAAF